MKIYNSRLEAKVEGQNEVNRLAVKWLPILLDALRPFVGVKCFNQGTAISQKLRNALPVLPNSVNERGFYTTGHGYTLRVDFQVVVGYPGHYAGNTSAHYAEATVYLADIDGLTIKRLYDNHNFRTDYTVQAVIDARKELKEAQAAVSRAQSKLFPFGEHDNC